MVTRQKATEKNCPQRRVNFVSASLQHLDGRGFLDSVLNLYVSLRLPPWR